MGFGGISPFQLIIILLIILLLFGGKRLRSLGSDLGSAIKGFRKSMDESDKKTPHALENEELESQDLKESQHNKSDKPKL